MKNLQPILNKGFALFLIFTLFISFSSIISTSSYAATQVLTDEQLLETIQRKSFDYFVSERDPKTGLVRDRADNFRGGLKAHPASIAATGFALTAYGLGVSRDWMDRRTAVKATRQTLSFFLNKAQHEHGFFYHFLDMKTGKRYGSSEISPIDTALLMAGALFAAEYYEDEEIRRLSQEIYERIDWKWMLNGGKTLALSWAPEQGFNRYRWDAYNELMIMLLLAIGSPTHALPPSSWDEIRRPVGSYSGYRLIQMPPLFTHQYSHAWIDFRDQNDGHADYFVNSVNATLANRAFCMSHADKFKSYGPNSWGLTATDGPFGYKAYGAPPGFATHDGTVAPTACGSSIVFTPKESIACMRHLYETLKKKMWGRYGFSSSFNLDRKWFSTEVIGIDHGALLLMIENYRTGFVWDVMSRSAAIQSAKKAVGFKPGTMEAKWAEAPSVQAPYAVGGMTVDGYLKDWPSMKPVTLDQSHREMGDFVDEKDLGAEVGFAWDENALYFYAKVKDDDLLLRKRAKAIWQDDVLELFIDPDGDGVVWNHHRDFQLGYRAGMDDEQVEAWSWFQGGESPLREQGSRAVSFVYEDGYIIEGAILWSYLGMQPKKGETLRISPAVNDIDRDRSRGKLQWFFRSEYEAQKQRFILGKVKLL